MFKIKIQDKKIKLFGIRKRSDHGILPYISRNSKLSTYDQRGSPKFIEVMRKRASYDIERSVGFQMLGIIKFIDFFKPVAERYHLL